MNFFSSNWGYITVTLTIKTWIGNITFISAASWEISAFFPLRSCREASNSSCLPTFACIISAMQWMDAYLSFVE